MPSAIQPYERDRAVGAAEHLWNVRHDPPTASRLAARFGFSPRRLEQVHKEVSGGLFGLRTGAGVWSTRRSCYGRPIHETTPDNPAPNTPVCRQSDLA